MYEIVSLVDDLIREISEILYYRKKERYTEIDDILGLISYNLRKLDEKIRENKKFCFVKIYKIKIGLNEVF